MLGTLLETFDDIWCADDFSTWIKVALTVGTVLWIPFALLLTGLFAVATHCSR